MSEPKRETKSELWLFVGIVAGLFVATGTLLLLGAFDILLTDTSGVVTVHEKRGAVSAWETLAWTLTAGSSAYVGGRTVKKWGDSRNGVKPQTKPPETTVEAP